MARVEYLVAGTRITARVEGGYCLKPVVEDGYAVYMACGESVAFVPARMFETAKDNRPRIRGHKKKKETET